jgi:hypothetical protein
MSEAQAWVMARTPRRTGSKAKAVMSIPLKSVAKEKHQVAEPACAEMEAEV